MIRMGMRAGRPQRTKGQGVRQQAQGEGGREGIRTVCVY